jgi:DNA-directed RNA polymerase subunit RPC12/RpoP
MMVLEKCQACQAEVEILLENARKQNECPACGHTFIPRHAINPAAFSAQKPSNQSYKGNGVFVGVLVVIGVIAGLFLSWLIGLALIVAAAVIYSLKEIASNRK